MDETTAAELLAKVVAIEQHTAHLEILVFYVGRALAWVLGFLLYKVTRDSLTGRDNWIG